MIQTYRQQFDWRIVVKTIMNVDRPLLLFALGLNLQIVYDIITASEWIVLQPLEYIAFALMWASIYYSLRDRVDLRIRVVHRYILFVLAFYILIISIRGLVFQPTAYALSRDIFALGYVSALFVGVKHANWKWLDKIFIVHFAATTIIAIIALIPYRSTLYYEAIIWTPLYKSWNNMYGWQYALLTSVYASLSRRLWTVAGITLYVVLFILFQKRTPLLASVLLFSAALILMANYIRTADRINVKALALAIVSVLVVPLVLVTLNPGIVDDVSSSADQLRERFIIGGTIETAVAKDGRFSVEAQNVIDEVSGSPISIALGRGIGAEIDVPVAVAPSGRSGVLHNGLANIILKGGVLLAVLAGTLLLLIIWDFRWIRDRHAYICLVLVCTSVALSPFQSFLNTGPLWAINFACIGYLVSIQLKHKREDPPTRPIVESKLAHE